MSEIAASMTDRVSRIRADLVDAWQRGEEVPVEDYFSLESGLKDDVEAVLELIYTEVVMREELGQHPSVDEYIRRFPHLADALSRQFDVHALLLDPGLGESAYSAPSTAHLDPLVTPAPGDSSSTQTIDQQRREETPRCVGGYEILGEIGHGGMGIVYKALQTGLRRIVALKMIAQSSVSAEGLTRFRTEAEAVARLQHANIVQVYEVGEHQGLPFLALEYVEGGSLADLLRGTPMAPQSAARLVVDLARAMQHAHSRGIIHRDLKPANILLDRHSSVIIPKIADFGLARHLDAENRQTRSGLIVGTPSYMPPEQAEGRHDQIGPTTDVYALGAILYEMLTGRPPFLAASTLDTLRQVIGEEPVIPSRLARGTPRDLETIALKCLQKDARKRYASSADLAADLERYLEGQPVLARRTPVWERVLKWTVRHPAAAALLAAVLVVTVAGLAAWVDFTNRLRAETQRAEASKDDADKAAERANKAAAEAERIRDQLEKVVRSQAMSVKEIAVTSRTAKVSGKDTGAALFDLACGYAETAHKILAETDLPIKLRQELANQYAESAVYLLNCSDEKAGYFTNPAQRAMLLDPRLKPLHGRADFKGLLDKHRVILP